MYIYEKLVNLGIGSKKSINFKNGTRSNKSNKSNRIVQYAQSSKKSIINIEKSILIKKKNPKANIKT